MALNEDETTLNLFLVFAKTTGYQDSDFAIGKINICSNYDCIAREMLIVPTLLAIGTILKDNLYIENLTP